jgi:hypothetical protein
VTVSAEEDWVTVQPWTRAEIHRMEGFARVGYSVRDLAMILDRSEGSVSGKIRDLRARGGWYGGHPPAARFREGQWCRVGRAGSRPGKSFDTDPRVRCLFEGQTLGANVIHYLFRAEAGYRICLTDRDLLGDWSVEADSPAGEPKTRRRRGRRNGG